MGDYPVFMADVWLLCGVDFLSKLQPNSGLEHAIGDANSSPTANQSTSAPEYRHDPSQSHMPGLVQRTQLSERALEGFTTLSRALLQPHFQLPAVSDDVKHPLEIAQAAKFFPQLRHKARAFTYCDGWNSGMRSVNRSNDSAKEAETTKTAHWIYQAED